MEIILEMLFLSLSNKNSDFKKKPKKLTWKLCIIVKTLPITNWVELIDKKNLLK